ncbi:MAG: hypothetical protein JEZ03_06320 [Bacteroidales bacterium]|nr:hypothetical protein [Bacteroidales bacterium]
MRTLIILFGLFIILINPAFTQKLDLVITSSGDSIACRIDGITNSEIFFEMKNKFTWTMHAKDLSEIVDHQKHAIRKSNVRFKSGTSIIKSDRINLKSIYDIPKNSILISTDHLFSVTASYEHIFPISQSFAFTSRAGGGITYESGNEPVVILNTAAIFGNRQGFADIGISYYQPIVNSKVFIPHIGYRFMGFKGFSLKVFALMNIYTGQDDIDEWGQFELGGGLQLGYRIWM